MAGKFTDTHPQFTTFDSTGGFAPNAGGEIEFFDVGTTGAGNRKDTFSDPALTIVNPNPLDLDGEGRTINPVFLDGTYNTIIRDAQGVQQDQVDDVTGNVADEGVPAQVVQFVADLKPIDTTIFKEAYVIGTTVLGDGGQGHFFFSSGSTESDNGVDVIEPTVGGGRWLLQNNAHNSFMYEQASGTTDAITINPTPIISTLDNARVYFVQSLGPNTVTAPTFKVGTSTTLTIIRGTATALVAGDMGPAGSVRILKLNEAATEYVLMNPAELLLGSVTNSELADMAQSTVKGRAEGTGTGAPIDLSVIQTQNIVFPKGGFVTMWSGTIAAIPTGWSICDGNNGTPNLLDRFVVSVPNAVTDPGATGGETDGSTTATTADSAGTPSGTNSGTAISIAQMPSHNHTIAISNVNNAGGGGSSNMAVGGSSAGDFTGGGATHTHTFTGSALGTHTHNSTNNFPSFFELAYIMFTG